MPRPSVKRKETLYASFVVLVFWDDYIVTHLDGIPLVILYTELAEGDIKEGILAPFAVVLVIAIVILILYTAFISHAYFARFWKSAYFG